MKIQNFQLQNVFFKNLDVIGDGDDFSFHPQSTYKILQQSEIKIVFILQRPVKYHNHFILPTTRLAFHFRNDTRTVSIRNSLVILVFP